MMFNLNSYFCEIIEEVIEKFRKELFVDEQTVDIGFRIFA